MKDPWTWTTVWELTLEVGDKLGEGKQKGKNWDNCKTINKHKKICK